MNGRLGRYELLARLGAGGTSEVWRGRLDGISGFARDVVLKRLRPELARDATFVKRLHKEARLAARLHHSNIVQVYEIFDDNGETVLVMEHLVGCDLLDLLAAHAKRSTRMPTGFAAYVAREVARGLAAAHAHRDDDGVLFPIVHRDVNPANVMLSNDGAVRLIDFGFAKAAGEHWQDQTATGVVFGKVGYLAPELLADAGHRREPEPSSDQFALGVTLHEMLTGARFPQPKGAARALHVEPPSRTNAEVSPDLDAICLRMLATDPAFRYATCHDVVDALDRVTREYGFGAHDAASQLAALGVVRGDEPPSAGVRETEDAGAAVFHDTRVNRRASFPMARVFVLGAGLGALAYLGWRSHRPATVAPRASAPTVAASAAVVVVPVPPSAPPAPQQAPPKLAPIRRRPARRATSKPAEKAVPAYDRIGAETIYDPFR